MTPTTPHNNEALEACPFCGVMPELFGNSRVVHGVVTDECPIAGKIVLIEAWNTRANQRASEVSPATVQDALDDVKFIRKELGRTWINQRQREVIEDIHARLHRIETALTHPREQQREDEGDVGR